MKKQSPSSIFFLVLILFLIGGWQKVSAAEGDLIWSQFNPAMYNALYDITVDNSGLYVAGYDYSSGNAQWVVEKRGLIDGILIWHKSPGLYYGIAYSITIDNSGVYVAGVQSDGAVSNWRIEKRRLDNGELTSSSWPKIVNSSTGNNAAYSLTIDNSGIYIAGYTSDPGTSQNQWLIEKRSTDDGSLIWPQVSITTGGYSKATSITIDAQDVYIFGYQVSSGAASWKIEKRRLDNGELTSSSWPKVTNSAHALDIVSGITIDSTGIYVAEYGPSIKIEKRSKNDGALIWTQPSSGIVPYDINLDNSGVYVVGQDSVSSSWRIEKRRLDNGELTSSSWPKFNSEYGVANSISKDNSGIYIAGYSTNPFDTTQDRWLIEKREIYIDCGLRFKTSALNMPFACEPNGNLSSPFRIKKDATTYGIVLVEITDPKASPIRIWTSSGVKALRKF